MHVARQVQHNQSLEYIVLYHLIYIHILHGKQNPSVSLAGQTFCRTEGTSGNCCQQFVSRWNVLHHRKLVKIKEWKQGRIFGLVNCSRHIGQVSCSSSFLSASDEDLVAISKEIKQYYHYSKKEIHPYEYRQFYIHSSYSHRGMSFQKR